MRFSSDVSTCFSFCGFPGIFSRDVTFLRLRFVRRTSNLMPITRSSSDGFEGGPTGFDLVYGRLGPIRNGYFERILVDYGNKPFVFQNKVFFWCFTAKNLGFAKFKSFDRPF